MTDSKSNINNKKRPVVILFGLMVTGVCLFWCFATVSVVIDPTFGSMGALIILTIAPCAAFLAFGMARFLFYADNASESWAVLSYVLSVIALCASGMSVSLLVGTFLPNEVEYRSLNLEGYKLLPMMAFFPLIMLGAVRLVDALNRIFSQLEPSERRPLVQFVRQNWRYDLTVVVLFWLVLTTSSFVLITIDPPLPASEKHLSYEDFYRKDSFPKDGSDFCYWRSNSTFFCDFSISEESFLDWAKTCTDWNINTIQSNTPVTVDQFYSEESFKVSDGVIAIRKQDASRIVEQAVFDRSTNRAYYHCIIL